MISSIPRILNVYGEDCFKFTDNFIRITLPINGQDHASDHASDRASDHASDHASEGVNKGVGTQLAPSQHPVSTQR